MLDETFERMVRKADITYEEVRKNNWGQVLTGGWLPLFTLYGDALGKFNSIEE